MLHHQFRSKKTLPHGILIGLLGAGWSRRKKKRRANTENSRSHFIPPHLSSGGIFRGIFTGTFRYDSPSLGIFRKISGPGCASRTSLGARHSASVCAAGSSSAGPFLVVLRSDVSPTTSPAKIPAVTPARVQPRHGRARLLSPAASAAACTRARKSTGGAPPCGASRSSGY